MQNKFRLKCIVSATLLAASALAATTSQAAEIDVGNTDWKVRWDNGIKYSNLYRLQDPKASYLGPGFGPGTGVGTQGTGAGDGNRNFDKGFASHRFDVLTEFDAIFKNKMGVRLSADGWYDAVYNRDNDNNTGISHNVSVPADEFSDGVRETMGRNLRMLDMYAFFKGDIGSMPFRVNVGQHATIYGESLLGGNNAIAAANGPVDIVKAATVPGAKVKEFLLPVPQISLSLQPTEKLKVGAYYQTSWRESQFFAPGSFLSPNDTFGKNAQSLLSRGPAIPFIPQFLRSADIDARDSGQWGTEIKYRPESVDVELGLYAVNWHDKVATALYLDPVPVPGGQSYRRVFAEDIRAYGVSASGVIAKHSISIESSYRDNMPIVGGAGFFQVVPANTITNTFDNDRNPAYAVGNTFHTTVVAINTIQPNFLMDGGSYVVQWDYHKLVDVDENPNARDRAMDGHANQVTFIFQPEYYNVIDGVDIQLPIVLGYSKGKSPIYAGWTDGGGTLDVGIKGTYRTVWEFGLNYRNYYGPKGQSIGSAPLGNGGQDQTLSDRDFLSFTLSRTF